MTYHHAAQPLDKGPIPEHPAARLGLVGGAVAGPTETFRTLRVETGDALVDVGCGDGYVTPPAAEPMDDAPVYAS